MIRAACSNMDTLVRHEEQVDPKILRFIYSTSLPNTME
jgi:hypothetical protein